MVASTRLSALAVLIALLASGAALTTTVVPPASQGQVDPIDNSLDLSGTTTDTDTIVSTVSVVSQKSGPTDDTPPNQPVPATVVTAVDGQLTEAGSGETRRGISMRSTSEKLSKRITSGYELVFSGTGTNSEDRDGSIQGTAYLTYKLLSNATYDVDGCLAFCSSVKDCVFANIYYEFNNELLDFVFNEKSNLKCALYADVHTAAEKTNLGGQQSEPLPAGLTYIQQSSGYASTALVDPPTPDGYELVFGPTNGANNAPGYMGFAFLDKYDVNACAQLCNTRNADPNGGACQYFNIWRALVNGIPTTYTCSMYFLVTDASTAVNTGQGDLQVTFSRGYRRKNFVIDGGFEGYTACSGFCFADLYANWIGISIAPGYLDASIFFFAPYAHAGHGSALLGSATDQDALPGTLTPANPLRTIAGQHYKITFFHASVYSGRTLEAAAFVQILWNGNIVSTITPGYSAWTFYSFDVTANGNDVLAFHGGKAPAWSFLDDICVFLT